MHVILSAILLARIAEAPMQPYGADTAHYIEHTARLDALQTLREEQPATVASE